MLFGLQSLALLLLGETPQQNAGTGQGPGSGANAQQSRSGGNAAPAQSGGPPGPAPNPVVAPPGYLQPQEIYTLDPDNPESRFTGVQAREAFIRAGQYDTLQSDFHRQQSELTQEREARQTAEQELQDIRSQERLANYMTQIGYAPQAQPSSQQAQPSDQFTQNPSQQPGQQPGGQGVGTGAEEDWLANYGSANVSPGQPDGSGNLVGQQAPGQPGSLNPGTGTNSSQSLLQDPRQAGLMMRAIIKDELSKTLTPVQQQIPDAINAAVDQRFNQQARQDGVRESFQAGRQQLSDDLLNKWGIEPRRSRDILDKWALSSASYEEASRLMQANYADDNQRLQAQNIADQKIGQGNMFFNAALQDAVTAAQEGQAVRMQTEAQNALLSGDFVNMGDYAEPQTNVWDPAQIEAITRANLTKAMEVAETTGRLQAVAGPIGGPQQPGGFLQPRFIQPGQPAGYRTPLIPTQPMWGTGQPGGQPARQPQAAPVAQPANAGQPPVQPNVQQGYNVQPPVQPNVQPQWGAFQQQGYGQQAA